MKLSRNLSVGAVAVVTYAIALSLQLWRGSAGERTVAIARSIPVTAQPAPVLPKLPVLPSSTPAVAGSVAAVPEPARPARPPVVTPVNEPAAAVGTADADPNAIPQYTPVQFWMSAGSAGSSAEGHLRSLSEHAIAVVVREENRSTHDVQQISISVEPRQTATFSSQDGLPLLPHDRISAQSVPFLARTTFVP